VGIGSKPKQCR